MFGLTWTEGAINALADIYIAATVAEGERMAAGVEALNSRLRASPLEEGESRYDGFRLTFSPLLTVLFLVAETVRHVFVGRVWRYVR